MWHTTEIAKIFMQMVDKYGYDIFNDKEKCIAVCSNLLSTYEMEKNIIQMLFRNGLGEKLNAILQSELEINRRLLCVEEFLNQQAIEQEVKEEILKIIQGIFGDKSANVDNNSFKPIITKSYSNLHFKMTIPEFIDFDDRMQFSFKFIWNKSEEEIDTVLEKCVITDKVKVIHSSHMDYSLFFYGKSRKANINVQHDTKKIFMTDAKIEFTFLCSNKKRVVTSYTLEHPHKLNLKHIEIYHMFENEYEKMLNIIQLLLKEDILDKPDIVKNTEIVDVPSYTSFNIQNFSDALRKEMLFLKQGKGKKYKIVNGVKINNDNGIYTYSFELETELHLPDDAPIVIDTASGFRAVGSVLMCEDFQIMLLIDRDLNDKVSSAYLMVEPWKLLEALNRRMISLNPNVNRLAVKLIEEGPKLSTTKDISIVLKGQDKAVSKLKQDDIVTVWGPPGTGKTYTMAEIAIEYIVSGKSVLIVSHSNVSVDGVVKKIVKIIDKRKQQFLNEGKILRLGYVRDDELSKHPYATSFNYALSKCPDLTKKMNSLSNKREELKAKNLTKSVAYDEIEKKLKKIREEIRKEERKYVEKAQLLGTTISRVTIDQMFEERQFDLVMFDEVSMAYVPQVIAAAALAKEKFMCVGDFRQLAPIAQGQDSKNVLQTDIFSYLKIVDETGNMYWHPWLVMLNEQRRMHPDISAFSNKYVYKNLLCNHSSVNYSRNDLVAAKPLAGDAMNLIDLAGTYCAASKNIDNSRFNILSAIVSFSTAVMAEKEGVDSVGIITPYAAQTRLIRAMIRDYYGYENRTISCATVHQFQGSEADVLVFDAVESYPTNKVGFLMGKIPTEVVRLINVAVTRAKGKLITVANAKFWNNTFNGTNHIFYKLLCHIQNGHNVVNHRDKTLETYIESINPGKMLQIFMDEAQAISIFEKDMMQATGRVVISIPDGELGEMSYRVLDMIDNAEKKGIDVLMKSNDYQELPDSWKCFARGTENAVFPLIVIDDEVAWYGLPTAKLKFKVDKTTSNITIVQVIVRIVGKNTIEMIKSLTDLENIQVGNNSRLLLPKKEHEKNSINIMNSAISENSMYNTRGIALFIEKKEFCCECKSHMKLAKNKKGTIYIRCSNNNCKNTKYLTPELMNWYIRCKNVTCPHNDGGELKGFLGKFGPCVSCSCGHFLKADEI